MVVVVVTGIAISAMARLGWLGMLCETGIFIAISVFHSETKVNPLHKKTVKYLFRKEYAGIGSAFILEFKISPGNGVQHFWV